MPNHPAFHVKHRSSSQMLLKAVFCLVHRESKWFRKLYSWFISYHVPGRKTTDAHHATSWNVLKDNTTNYIHFQNLWGASHVLEVYFDIQELIIRQHVRSYKWDKYCSGCFLQLKWSTNHLEACCIYSTVPESCKDMMLSIADLKNKKNNVSA